MLSFSSRDRAYIPPIIISCGHRFLAVWLTAALLSSESSHPPGETHIFMCNFFGRIIPPRVDIATPRLILCPDYKFIFFISFYKIDLEIKVLILQKKKLYQKPQSISLETTLTWLHGFMIFWHDKKNTKTSLIMENLYEKKTMLSSNYTFII